MVSYFHQVKEERKVIDLALILQKSKIFLNLYFDKSFFHVVCRNSLQLFRMLLKLACIFQ